MNELIKIQHNENEDPVISGRELHEFLEVATAYKDWFPRMVEYGFDEGKDFCSKMSESTGGRPAQDHLLTIPMAKELCMIQRTEKGKQARQYFIQLEAAWNTPEMVMARALRMADKKILSLATQIEAQKPLVEFAETIQKSEDSLLVREVAKVLGTGEKRLFQMLRDWGLLYRHEGRNIPYAKYVGTYFEVIESQYISDNEIRLALTTRVLPKGQVYIAKRLKQVAAL